MVQVAGCKLVGAALCFWFEVYAALCSMLMVEGSRNLCGNLQQTRSNQHATRPVSG